MKRAFKYIAITTIAGVIVVTVALFIARHYTTQIIVVDDTGTLIQGAEVIPHGLSINYAAELTDADGGARLPLVMQQIQWVTVRKKGFEDYRTGYINHSNRIVVILTKEPKH